VNLVRLLVTCALWLALVGCAWAAPSRGEAANPGDATISAEENFAAVELLNDAWSENRDAYHPERPSDPEKKAKGDQPSCDKLALGFYRAGTWPARAAAVRRIIALVSDLTRNRRHFIANARAPPRER
jgi:hypothetical protein